MMSNNLYYTLENKEKNNVSEFGEIASSILVEKKSKFISYVFSISNQEEATKYIDIVKKKHYTARHVVYIYSYLENKKSNIKFSDDGEPKGTGTKAIYETITKEKITNICIVIVRYFGGILLGAGPLSRTYLNSARNSLLKCFKQEIYNYSHFAKKVKYDDFEKDRYYLNIYESNKKIKNLKIEYTDDVMISCDVIDTEYEKFCNDIN